MLEKEWFRGVKTPATVSDGEREQDERIRENLQFADWENMDYFEFEEMFEDRDPLEFL